MSLTGALQIGRSALNASQLAIQVAGNNVANAATPGFTRQSAVLAPTQDARFGGQFIGRGVEVAGIRRQIDSALQARLLSGNAGEQAAQTDLRLISGVEALLDGLGENNVATQLDRFFASFSELANSPAAEGARSLVVQQGQALGSFVQNLRAQLLDQRVQIDRELGAAVTGANDLLTRIAELNTAIVTAEQGRGSAGSLRDQRDQLLSQLAETLDITAIEQPSGAVDVLVGSTPIVLAGQSRGVRLRLRADGDQLSADVVTADRSEVIPVRSGSIGSLLTQRTAAVDQTVERLDQLSAQLIFQVNRAHSQGLTAEPLTSVTADRAVTLPDQARALNDPANTAFAPLPFAPTSGSFTVTVRNAQTGSSQSAQVQIDLDGITAAGAAGFADDTSLDSLRASLGSVANLTATIGADGRLRVEAAPGFEVSFGDDTSGVLAVLGVNTFFSGTDAATIGVRPELLSRPNLLAAGRVSQGVPSDNATALEIAGLRQRPIPELGGVTFLGQFDQTVQSVAVRVGAARTASQAALTVRQNLEAQRAAVSGVSLDEEAINLINFQSQYQASARFISTVEELTQALLALI
ncbi:MAG: flagellar hook-associated protein FlgK [Planctomyces sp.]|nr:flagellar hook-associated protein FlgK [Planctomyces sp.]MBA4039852.1 flagellar hook-associated protein FlgK [Planctomyces sp.]MBA4120783.1 flagellar hook-associated protein FlgK [Isosphaera sp.]